MASKRKTPPSKLKYFLDRDGGHKLGLNLYRSRTEGYYHRNHEEFQMPLCYGNMVYDVYPNEYLYKYSNQIYQWLVEKERIYEVYFDVNFEWMPQRVVRRENGLGKLDLGIVYTRIQANELYARPVLMWNYTYLQSGEHINKKALENTYKPDRT